MVTKRGIKMGKDKDFGTLSWGKKMGRDKDFGTLSWGEGEEVESGVVVVRGRGSRIGSGGERERERK